MIDRLLFAVFTLCLLVAASLLTGSALLGNSLDATSAAPAATGNVRYVELPRVEVVGKRLTPNEAVARSEGGEPASRGVQ